MAQNDAMIIYIAQNDAMAIYVINDLERGMYNGETA